MRISFYLPVNSPRIETSMFPSLNAVYFHCMTQFGPF
jgi:hypothetical protein